MEKQLFKMENMLVHLSH